MQGAFRQGCAYANKAHGMQTPRFKGLGQGSAIVKTIGILMRYGKPCGLQHTFNHKHVISLPIIEAGGNA